MARTKFKPSSIDHWFCRLIGRHPRATVIGQTCSEPEWSYYCSLCDHSGGFFIPTPEDEKFFGQTPTKVWFL